MDGKLGTKISNLGKNHFVLKVLSFEVMRILRNVLKTTPFIKRNGRMYSVDGYYKMLQRRKSLDT